MLLFLLLLIVSSYSILVGLINQNSPTCHPEKDGKEDIADINTRSDKKKHRSQEKNTSERFSDRRSRNEMEMGWPNIKSKH